MGRGERKKGKKRSCTLKHMICGDGENRRKGKFLNVNSGVHKDQIFGTRTKAEFFTKSNVLEAFY